MQTRAALERLDAELAQKARYQQWRQEQADELRGRIDAKAPTAEQAEQVFAVAQVFVTFDLDSSAYYVDRLYRLAERSGSRYERAAGLAGRYRCLAGPRADQLRRSYFPENRYRRYDSA